MTRARKISLAFAALVVLMACALWWLVATESGLRFVWGRVVAFSPVPLAGEVHGTLLGPLQVEKLRIQLRGARVEAASADLDWVPRGLMEGRLMFSRADFHQVVVTVTPQARSSGPVHVLSPRFPIDLRGQIDALTLRFAPTPGETGSTREIRFSRVGVDGSADPARLKLRALTLDGYGAHFEADGEAALRADGPVRLATRWSWQPPQGEKVRGHGTITGTVVRPRTDQSLDETLEGAAEGSLVWLDQPLQWQAEVNARPVNVARLDRRARPVVVGGRLHAEGGAGRLRVSVNGHATDPTLGPWNFQAEGARIPDGWQLPSVTLGAADGPARVSASGFLYTAGAAAVALDLEWSGFPVPRDAVAASPSGRVTVHGSLDDYQVAGTARLARFGLPEGDAQLEGSGDRSAFRVTTLRAAWLDGEVSGTGRVQWKPFLAWEAELRARDLNPGRWRADYPGRLSAHVVSKGERRKEGLMAELALDEVSGALRGNPVSGRGRFLWEKDLLKVEGFDLVNGTAGLAVEGEMGARWDLRAEVSADRIQDLVPGVAGRVQAELRVSGPRKQPWLRAEASGADLEWQGRRAGRLSLKASVDLGGTNPWDARFGAEALHVGGFDFDRVDLSGEGSPADHHLTLDAVAAGRTFHLEGHGSYAAQRWQGELSAGRLDDPQLGNWVQAEAIPFSVDPRAVTLGRGCWTHEGGSLCLGLTGGIGREWNGEAELHAVPVAAVQPFLRQGFEVTGLLDGRASFRFQQALTALDLDLAATEGAFRFLVTGAEPVTTPYRRIDLQLHAGPRGFDGESHLLLANGDQAQARWALPRWRPGQPFSPEQPLRGSAQVDMGELEWVTLFSPDLVASGRLQGRLALAGTLGHPLVEGEAALRDGRLAIPILGIALTELRLAVHAEGPSAMTIDASARSGPGRLAVSGRATAEAEGWALALKVTGDGVEVARLPQARILATPDLQLAIRDHTIRVRGSVLIPQARIDLTEITAPVQPSADVVIVDQPENGRRRWTIVSEITLRFGEDVKFSGYGFSGNLAGELVVVEPEEGGALGRGELQIVDGKYTSYGQDLTIEEGRLLYGNAPLNNPGIQFKAIRRIEDMKVGVLATGRLKKPEVRLYSEPAMDDTQILAWLVLGRPLETVTADESATLQRAAISLGLVGGAELARRVGEQAGLDVVNVQPAQGTTSTFGQNVQTPGAGSATGTGTTSNGTSTTATQAYQASLVLGKYLSPRLYVQYAVGIGDAGNAWQMRYLLDKNWTVKAESGLQSGVDLLYTIEK